MEGEKKDGEADDGVGAERSGIGEPLVPVRPPAPPSPFVPPRTPVPPVAPGVRAVRSKGPDRASERPVGRVFSADGGVDDGGGVYGAGAAVPIPLPMPCGRSDETVFGRGAEGPGVKGSVFTVEGPLAYAAPGGSASGRREPAGSAPPPPPKGLPGPGSSLRSVNWFLLPK